MNHSKEACRIVRKRIKDNLNKGTYSDDFTFKVYIVIATYILGNEKYLISSDIPDGKYFEVTYNVDKDEFYLDEYVRIYNERIPREGDAENELHTSK